MLIHLTSLKRKIALHGHYLASYTKINYDEDLNINKIVNILQEIPEDYTYKTGDQTGCSKIL